MPDIVECQRCTDEFDIVLKDLVFGGEKQTPIVGCSVITHNQDYLSLSYPLECQHIFLFSAVSSVSGTQLVLNKYSCMNAEK